MPATGLMLPVLLTAALLLTVLVPKIGEGLAFCGLRPRIGRRSRCAANMHGMISASAMAAVLGAILKLPPVHRAMAGRQMGSRYLDKLIERSEHKEHRA